MSEMEQITTELADMVADASSALAAETALEIMSTMDTATKQQFLSLLLAQTLATGQLDGIPNE